ncbi:MAG: hypothetical protein ABW201_08635 [Candidatus Thiodiazotropha sp.]
MKLELPSDTADVSRLDTRNHTLRSLPKSVIDHSGFNPKPYNKASSKIMQHMAGTVSTARPIAKMPLFSHTILHFRNLLTFIFAIIGRYRHI